MSKAGSVFNARKTIRTTGRDINAVSKFSVGDTVQHRSTKQFGTVRAVDNDGSIRVRFQQRGLEVVRATSLNQIASQRAN